MSLSGRDRVKINAALVLLRDWGIDPAKVTGRAAAGINIGTPAKAAYERAFNALVADQPELQAPLMRLGQFVEATDERTLAGYSLALDRFIASGDRRTLDTIMPTVKADLAELAARTGDAGFAEGLETIPDAPQPSAPQEAPTAATGWGPTGYTPSEASE